MAEPSRLGAIVVVTVLSCVVLGAVWGMVMYVMPQSDNLPQVAVPALRTPSTVPSPSQALNIPEAPAHLPPPVRVTEAPVEDSMPSGRPASGSVRVPFGMDMKCAMEMDSLCSDDEGDRVLCLERKATQVSTPCRPIFRERLVRLKENVQLMRGACETDRRQYCRNETLDGRAIIQCLEAHAQEVSDECFTFLPKRGRLLN